MFEDFVMVMFGFFMGIAFKIIMENIKKDG